MAAMKRWPWLMAWGLNALAAGALAADAVSSGPAPGWRSLDETVAAARDDAARRGGLDASAIELVSAESVTWRDGSLGCAEPGRLYTQALVPGYRVRVRAGGEVLDYHASRRGALVLCPPGRASDPLLDQARR
jgi:hypothetical protein